MMAKRHKWKQFGKEDDKHKCEICKLIRTTHRSGRRTSYNFKRGNRYVFYSPPLKGGGVSLSGSTPPCGPPTEHEWN